LGDELPTDSIVAPLQELERFLLKCFEKSPIQRPGAAVLLEDPWIQGNKRHMFCS
jgi:serine/threonine protein kinase